MDPHYIARQACGGRSDDGNPFAVSPELTCFDDIGFKGYPKTSGEPRVWSIEAISQVPVPKNPVRFRVQSESLGL